MPQYNVFLALAAILRLLSVGISNPFVDLTISQLGSILYATVAWNLYVYQALGLGVRDI